MGAVKGKSLQVHMCPICRAYSTKLLAHLDRHFQSAHGKSSEEVWISTGGEIGQCGCGCGESTRWCGWGKGYTKFVNGHNAFIHKIHSPEEAQRIIEHRAAALRGKPSWCKGLTKDNDERVAKRGRRTAEGRKSAFNDGRITAWNAGKTKDTDERVRREAERLAGQYASGEIVPWAKGKTKQSDEKVKTMSMNVSLALRKKDIREHLDGLKRLSDEEIKSRIEDAGYFDVLDGLQNYVNISSRVIVARCKTCMNVTQGSMMSLTRGRCFNCSPGGSRAQEDVARWVESLGFEVIRNDRRRLPGLELDIYVPKKNFAIEYNGLYWHSHVNKSPAYHDNKSKMASESGIRLFHVFEDEWRSKKAIVQSLLKRGLEISSPVTGTYKTKTLSIDERKRFFETNHLEGDASCTIAFGAIDDDDQVLYAMGLRQRRHANLFEQLEIVRECPRLGLSGSIDLLMKKTIEWSNANGYKKIIIQHDTRLGGTELGYVAAGFREASRTPPRWWWTDFDDRFNRFKYRADSSRGLTEAAVAEKAGVVKIWGCENRVYEMHV